jgi:hypothetical protein
VNVLRVAEPRPDGAEKNTRGHHHPECQVHLRAASRTKSNRPTIPKSSTASVGMAGCQMVNGTAPIATRLVVGATDLSRSRHPAAPRGPDLRPPAVARPGASQRGFGLGSVRVVRADDLRYEVPQEPFAEIDRDSWACVPPPTRTLSVASVGIPDCLVS